MDLSEFNCGYIKVKRKNNLATKEQIPTAWFLTVVGKSSAVYK